MLALEGLGLHRQTIIPVYAVVLVLHRTLTDTTAQSSAFRLSTWSGPLLFPDVFEAY